MNRHRRDKARPPGGLTEEQKQEIRCVADADARARHGGSTLVLLRRGNAAYDRAAVRWPGARAQT
jgi:hypothetical protein